MKPIRVALGTWFMLTLLVGCAGVQSPGGTQGQPTQEPKGALRVLAVETFLADIAQNLAGSRLRVDALLPVGVDPHSFEPRPSDIARVTHSNMLIVNGAGLEAFLGKLLQEAGGQREVIEAAAGLTSRTPREGELVETTHEGDPHFWLDPNNVIQYVENIRDGLSRADLDGKSTYAANADAYIQQLKELDRWIAEQVSHIPEKDRLLVTNHESFGYFADRYGFQIVGTIVPSVSTGVSPSARQLALLVDRVRATGAKAIFLETGTNPQLAQQVARETGIKVVTGLYTHSTTGPAGPAPTYIEMIQYNTQAIVGALE